MKDSSGKQIKILDTYFEEQKRLNAVKKKAAQEKIPLAEDAVCRFLELFCFAVKPAHVLEIGCGWGYSSYFLTKGLQGTYVGIDLNRDRVKKAEAWLGHRCPHQISFLAGDALEVTKELDIQFDLVFIDGAKHQYPDYLKALMGKLSKKSFILADNVLYKGLVFSNNVPAHHKNSVAGIREYLFLVSNKNNFSTRIINIGDGLAISEVRI